MAFRTWSQDSMCAFFYLPDPANSHFTGLGDNTTRTDYRVLGPVRVVHCKSAESQPAIPNSHRDSRSLRRTPVVGSKLPCALFEAFTRRCESQVRHRVRFPSPAQGRAIRIFT